MPPRLFLGNEWNDRNGTRVRLTIKRGKPHSCPNLGTVTDYILYVEEHLPASIALDEAKRSGGIVGYYASLPNGGEIANLIAMGGQVGGSWSFVCIASEAAEYDIGQLTREQPELVVGRNSPREDWRLVRHKRPDCLQAGSEWGLSGQKFPRHSGNRPYVC